LCCVLGLTKLGFFFQFDGIIIQGLKPMDRESDCTCNALTASFVKLNPIIPGWWKDKNGRTQERTMTEQQQLLRIHIERRWDLYSGEYRQALGGHGRL
jgi:hypothetical protein